MGCYTQQKVLKRIIKHFLYNSTSILTYNNTQSKTKHTHQKKMNRLQREKADSHRLYTELTKNKEQQ